ncbi:sugar-binding transcriptional regulator [Virgibacillus siamensis]|uniref:sugar-binding transcriptional regulator n=1 Tax=Virgibacillus siamensis TaxID=480071 RepID=UPI0009870AB5|nr:sugar-binding domain-containing protein [Virgibacillus siamensis]
MWELIDVQKKLYPDLLEIMQRRYSILQHIELLQPIGRRSLADNTEYTERFVRGEVDFLQEQGLIHVTAKGMQITKAGKLVIDHLSEFMREAMGLSVLEKQLKDRLQVKEVIIVPGNSDEHNWVKQEMGKVCISNLKKVVKTGMTIAVTGGTTMAAAAEMMTPFEHAEDCRFVPARGGIGEKEENQANTIAARMARQANGSYRLLYVPDPLSETSYQTMINEPSIQDTLQLIKSAGIVLHGIGDALTMAERRKTPKEVYRKLEKSEAVSEAFGYYFDRQGDVVHKVRTIGIQLDDLTDAQQVMTIAGGESKANAIASYFKKGNSDLLITDEAAAEKILKG